MAEPFISFIIPAFNSEKTLNRCLESIFSVSYPGDKYEVIVVDNGSTDATVTIAEHYPLRLLNKPVGTISMVRNFGSFHAKGEFYAFVDSDCVIRKDWLREAVSVLSDSSVGAVGSGYLTAENYTWVEKAWLYELNSEPFQTDFIPGGNLVVKAAVFKMVGGFDDKLITGEDADLCFRINKSMSKVINSSRMKNVHLGNSKSISQFIKKEFWYGKNSIDNIITNPFDKVFYLSLMIAVCTMSLLLNVVSKTLNIGSNITAPIVMIMMITFASSCYRIKKSRKYKYIIHLNLLYYLYYLVRSIALMKSVYDRLRAARRRDLYEIT